MRISRLSIENFRGVRRFEIVDLKNLVVIAGPNGCGKSAVLDAIRLLKSFYGGYQPNEWQQWMGEFQINVSSPDEIKKLFGDPARDLRISATIDLAETEVDYLRENAEEVLTPLVWARTLGRAYSGSLISSVELRQYGQQVDAAVAAESDELRMALVGRTYEAGLHIPHTGGSAVVSSLPLEVLFQTYTPEVLGVIDYHSASRSYEREGVGGVNLNLDAMTQQRRNLLLYNPREKYRNVKTELASHYVHDIIAARAGIAPISDLNETLVELFQTFFPDKSYQGVRPRPDGALNFPVRLVNGQEHDIDDLSAGEKEVLYGYLRLRNSAPQNSILMIDEPELHLNPRLLQGLPDFYHTHLGRALDNQLWLVTHSDAILRQAVGNPDFSVYHMSPSTTLGQDENQAREVAASDELERAVLALVGDLAAYKPRAKVVLFEGGGDSEVDITIAARLFPVLAQSLNFVSAGHKKRVRDLYSVLSNTAERAGLSERFYAIVDRDREVDDLPDSATVRQWDRYHIENYLLDDKAILSAVGLLLDAGNPFSSETDVATALLEAAASLVNRLVLERLQDEINTGLVNSIRVRASPDTVRPGVDLKPSIDGSMRRFVEQASKYQSDAWLAEREARYRTVLESALTSEEWRSEFPGRSILSRFVERHVPGVSYGVLKNVVVERMVELAIQPEGMKAVLDEINEM